MKKIWKPSFEVNDLQIKSKKLLCSSYLKLLNYNIKIKLFKDKNTKIITRELFISKNNVSILLFDPYTKYILFVEQFRIGNIKKNPWSLEIISGNIDSGSDNILNSVLKENVAQIHF